MEIQLTVAATRDEAIQFAEELVAKGYVLGTDDGTPFAKKIYYDYTDAVRAYVRVSFLGFNANTGFEYNVSVEYYEKGKTDPVYASWLSVHRYNVEDKLRLVEALLRASLTT